MNAWTLKIISIPTIAILNFITGFLPFFFISRHMKLVSHKADHNSTATQIAVLSPAMKRLLSLANFFSAGVFLSTCLIGLYPGVSSKFTNIVKKNPAMASYPYEGLSVALGFFLVWLLEILVHFCIHSQSSHDHGDHNHDRHSDQIYDHSHDHHDHHDTSYHSHDHHDTSHHSHDHHDTSYHSHDHHDTSYHSHDHNYHSQDHHDHRESPPPTLTSPTPNSISKECNSTTIPLTFLRTDIEDRLLIDCDRNEDPNMGDHLERMAPLPLHDQHEVHSHVPVTGSALGSVMLTFALGSHSVIEGIGFGVLDDLSTVINMFVTMAIHESICALSLGVNIASKKTPLKLALLLILVFAVLIPLGIGLGLIVNVSLHKNVYGEVTVAVLQGVAAGTFLYVVFMEILPVEIAASPKKDEMLRLFIMIVGFAVIAAMKASHSETESTPVSNQTIYYHSVTSAQTH